MTTLPVPAVETAPGTTLDLEALAARAAGLAEGARADATRKAYRSDWRHFAGWCAGHGLVDLPAMPSTVGLYLAAHETLLSIATLTRRLSAIAVAHRMAGHPMDTRHPAIRDVMRGLRRANGVAQGHAEALTVPLLRRLLATCGDRLLDQRDRALLLVAFGAALRRSELVALEVADIAVVPDGLRIAIRRSKGDQEGEGVVIAVGRTGSETCPAAAYTTWLGAAGIMDGAVFRGINRHGQLGRRLSTDAIAEIVQKRAAAAGLEAGLFSGHSMRAGFATSAAQAGVEERLIMRQTRHRSAATVRRYIRDGQLFDRNLAQEIGL
ncbi:tyrosine-type recombinase/integrase [Methylobacterium brachythecii]|uniref:Integrase n=1 Tax=Methylobacterium brachythecii TaxID=1176177 RepID=A0A7W6ALJ8_9HYPH|nr:tyrosine-type recombinase/integrase [Methylobacterium brachythecii]MBB3905678.1 integrase [Methylobacterium brachythecii]GLS46944.1 integrase [Methylobacterium brachythecii]